jgi:energy-coupling factor transporter ATP-binding protein EcfA2
VTLRAEGWGWRHGTRLAWAVRGLDLHVEDGERVLLLGPSGAGKSTLLAGLAGLLDPEQSGDEEGRLLLDSVPARVARVAAVRGGRARTGLLLQDPQAQTVLARVGDDVAFGLENHGVPAAQIWPRVDDALAAVGLEPARDHPTARLSGGQRQRLALAGALALRPTLFLFDEPTAMLDPAGAEQIRASVDRVLSATGAGMVLVEHRVEPWLPLVDRVVVLAPGGGVMADGEPGRVFAAHGPDLAAAGVWVPRAWSGRSGRSGLPDRLPDRSAGSSPRNRSAGSSGQAGPVGRQELPAHGWSAGSSGQTGPAGRKELPAHRWAPGAARPQDGEPLLQARGLAVARPRSAPVRTGVDLDLARGRAVTLTGPNGSGKSTLALTVAGLLRPAGGILEALPALARGLRPEPVRWRSRDLISRIGTVFQDPQLQFVTATVGDELRLSADDRRADELMARLRLDHLARANPFTVSGGEQRRLSVATALAARPDLLVLDEPTFGQDARTWAELLTLFEELLTGGTALLIATHDVDLDAALRDPVAA